MCLAVPGKVVEFVEFKPPFVSALVEFGAVRRLVSLACVPEAAVGDYVMVHAGIAISRVNEREAAKVLEALEQLDLAGELDELSENKMAEKPQGVGLN
jgi:hydrogenase expression/formation protein HypC